MGQTGVQNLSLWFVRFIGITEVLGAIGIVLPWAIGVYPVLTPISAFCFAFIMPFAAVIHHKLGEPKNVATNIIFFCICMFIGIMRMMNV